MYKNIEEKMIRVKNENDLLRILRVISSEAVDLSKKKINENSDPTVRRYTQQYKKDESLYGNLSEQEEEVEEEVPETETEVEEEAPEEESEENSDSTESAVMGASFDSVVQAVNQLRAGKSLRDSSIKQQAQIYYDKLSEDERTTLLVFLNALSDIIAGQINGKDAQDPGDPPLSISISSEDGEAEEDSEEVPETEVETEEEAPEEESEETMTPEEPSEEDTTPPIKVNESQDLIQLRKKVRRMMLRG